MTSSNNIPFVDLSQTTFTNDEKGYCLNASLNLNGKHGTINDCIKTHDDFLSGSEILFGLLFVIAGNTPDKYKQQVIDDAVKQLKPVIERFKVNNPEKVYQVLKEDLKRYADKMSPQSVKNSQDVIKMFYNSLSGLYPSNNTSHDKSRLYFYLFLFLLLIPVYILLYRYLTKSSPSSSGMKSML